MKKIYLLFLILISINIIVYSQDKSQSIYPPEIKKIINSGKLIVAMHSKDFIPFIMKNNKGELVGYDVELARGIAKTLNVELVLNRDAKTFNEIVDIVSSGRADLGISLISRTLVRAEKVRFSDPYLILRPTLLLNRVKVSKYLEKDSKDVVKALQIDNLKIAEPKGNAYIDMAKSIFPKSKVTEKDIWDDVMTSVLNGENDIVVRDEIGVKNYIYQNPEQSVKLQMVMLNDPKYYDYISIALPTKSTHFLEWINLYLEKNKDINNADDLIKRYSEFYGK